MTNVSTITPPDCHARAALLRVELEVLRTELGKRADARAEVRVEGAEPRDCWFAAAMLLRRADRLAMEAGAPQAAWPSPPSVHQIRPGDVHALLDAALGRVHAVAERLGVDAKASEKAKETSKTPSDVLASVVQASRQLDLLLERPITPGDVFSQVAVASSYAGALLAAYGKTAQTDLPAFDRRKRPADCNRRLLGVLEKLGPIAKRVGATVPTIQVTTTDEQVPPSDCLDSAALVTSSLANLVSRAGVPGPALAASTGDRKTPSHVYQLAGVLEARVAALAAAVESDPKPHAAR